MCFVFTNGNESILTGSYLVDLTVNETKKKKMIKDSIVSYLVRITVCLVDLK